MIKNNSIAGAFFLCFGFIAAVFFQPAFGYGWKESSIEFHESQIDVPNPDRGFFNQLRVEDLPDFRLLQECYLNCRVYFVLDRFIDQPISDLYLRELGKSLEAISQAKHRIVARFIYDWPSQDVVDSGLTLRRARTANPIMMSKHIRQLGSVLQSHTKAVFAVESGLIGFWGEQHGDTPDKQSPGGIASIADQWRSVLAGTSIQVLVRYPKALREHVRLHPEMLVEQPRLGYWNDCLGASDDANMSPTEVSVVGGETCGLPPRIDYTCATMMAYFKAIQLDLLHANYFRPIIDRWEKGGCLDEIRLKLGYRYVIREARLAADGSCLEVRIDNVGWGMSRLSRPLFLMANGRRIQKIADLVNFLPGTVNRVSVQLSEPLSHSLTLSLETDDRVQFSNQTGNLLYRSASAAP
ncbi:DUF4874 domain-containing protein [Sphaerotilus montanus]|uniref:DUF4874 domain-containing protein n=1 Tax=Sphaerotilus montanus TaxID=522889 RepID=UPI003FA2B87E